MMKPNARATRTFNFFEMLITVKVSRLLGKERLKHDEGNTEAVERWIEMPSVPLRRNSWQPERVCMKKLA
jgi:hypothetical protein